MQNENGEVPDALIASAQDYALQFHDKFRGSDSIGALKNLARVLTEIVEAKAPRSTAQAPALRAYLFSACMLKQFPSSQEKACEELTAQAREHWLYGLLDVPEDWLKIPSSPSQFKKDLDRAAGTIEKDDKKLRQVLKGLHLRTKSNFQREDDVILPQTLQHRCISTLEKVIFLPGGDEISRAKLRLIKNLDLRLAIVKKYPAPQFKVSGYEILAATVKRVMKLTADKIPAPNCLFVTGFSEKYKENSERLKIMENAAPLLRSINAISREVQWRAESVFDVFICDMDVILSLPTLKAGIHCKSKFLSDDLYNWVHQTFHDSVA